MSSSNSRHPDNIGLASDRKFLLRLATLVEQYSSPNADLEKIIRYIHTTITAIQRISKTFSVQREYNLQELAAIEEAEAWLNKKSVQDFILACKAMPNDSANGPTSHRDESRPMSELKRDSVLMRNRLSLNLDMAVEETHDLDWDLTDLELSLTPDNPISPDDSSPIQPVGKKLSPLFDLPQPKPLSMNPESEVAAEEDPTEYQGVYEEIMEMSLELEEGCYSDDEEFPSKANPPLQPTLPVNASTSRLSMYELPVDDLKLSSPIECQHNYQLINIDDDLQSVSSWPSLSNSPAHCKNAARESLVQTEPASYTNSKSLWKSKILEELATQKSPILTPKHKRFQYHASISPSIRKKNYTTLRHPVFV